MGVTVDEKLTRKKLKIVTDDGSDKPFSIVGEIVSYNEAFIVVLTDGKERILPLSRVIRMEEVRA